MKSIVLAGLKTITQGKRDKKHIDKENRQREANADKRCGCNAIIRICAKKNGGYEVANFVREHTH